MRILVAILVVTFLSACGGEPIDSGSDSTLKEAMAHVNAMGLDPDLMLEQNQLAFSGAVTQGYGVLTNHYNCTTSAGWWRFTVGVQRIPSASVPPPAASTWSAPGATSTTPVDFDYAGLADNGAADPTLSIACPRLPMYDRFSDLANGVELPIAPLFPFALCVAYSRPATPGALFTFDDYVLISLAEWRLAGAAGPGAPYGTINITGHPTGSAYGTRAGTACLNGAPLALSVR
jgi:hypothetical protein